MQGANHPYYSRKTCVLYACKFYMNTMLTGKHYPDECPQVHYDDGTFYHSYGVIYKADDGGENIPLARKLHRQFYVYLCCALEHISASCVAQSHTGALAVAL